MRPDMTDDDGLELDPLLEAAYGVLEAARPIIQVPQQSDYVLAADWLSEPWPQALREALLNLKRVMAGVVLVDGRAVADLGKEK